MPISDDAITGRRLVYGCCASRLAQKYNKQRAIGNDDCAEETMLKMRFMLFARDVMNNYRTSTETPNGVCFTEAFVCDVICQADPGCVVCCEQTIPDQGVDPCAITPNFTVDGVTTQADAGSQPDGSYLITNYGGGDVSIIGNIVGGVIDGGSIFIVPDGQVVLDSSTSVYYTSFMAITTLLYPGIVVSMVFSPSTFNILSGSAPFAYLQNRPITIEAYNGSTWVPVFSGAEQQIASGLVLSTTGVVDFPQNFRIKYFEGECLRGPVDATSFNNTPPFTNAIIGNAVLFPAVNPIRLHRGEVLGPYTEVDAFDQLDVTRNGRFNKIRKSTEIPDYNVAVGQFGVIRFSDTYGASWSTPGGNWTTSPDIPDYDAVALTSLYYRGFGLFVTGGSGGALFKSEDFGATFNYVPQDPAMSFITSVVACSADIIVVGTHLNGVWRTDDAGATWTQVLVIGTVSNMDAYGDIVLVFLQSGGVYRSTDQGVTWPVVPNSATLNVRDSRFDALGNIVYAAGAGRFKSVDGGQSWITQESSLSTRTGVAPLTSTIVLYAITNQLSISLDGGTTISPITAPLDGGLYAVEGHIMT